MNEIDQDQKFVKRMRKMAKRFLRERVVILHPDKDDFDCEVPARYFKKSDAYAVFGAIMTAYPAIADQFLEDSGYVFQGSEEEAAQVAADAIDNI